MAAGVQVNVPGEKHWVTLDEDESVSALHLDELYQRCVANGEEYSAAIAAAHEYAAARDGAHPAGAFFSRTTTWWKFAAAAIFLFVMIGGFFAFRAYARRPAR